MFCFYQYQIFSIHKSDFFIFYYRPEGKCIDDGEEDFYFNEIEVGQDSPPPTFSHLDMARPPHEDPEYQRQIVGNYRQQFLSGPINIPHPTSPHKLLKLSPRPLSPKTPVSPRRVRGENKKCRKVYGMDHREQWCTQCKWKKACSRFGDWFQVKWSSSRKSPSLCLS